MPKTALERNTFVRGLITESTPLTFPENASIAEDNFVLNRDGSRKRRLGIDYEDGYALTTVVPSGAGYGSVEVSTFSWKNAGDNPDNTVGVVQVGKTLYFMDLTLVSPSAGAIPTLTLPSAYDSSKLQYVPIKGVLVCVGDAGDAFYITRVDASTYTKTDIDLKVRDIWGIDDGLAVDERPVTLEDDHEYNLLNQGWTDSNITKVAYPSNADVMQYGKNATDDFSKAFLNKQFFGTTPAPKGKFVIDAFDRGSSRETESGVSPLPVDQESGRCTTVASYAGRVFYAGVTSSITSADNNSPSYTGTIFFSRIVDGLDKLGQCHQEADPTSEHISDLIPTDGGTIDIPEASNIYKLIANQTSLVVVAKNGVWEITGPDGVFAADDFSISQVTNVGAINADSVINAEGTIMYWGTGGIYVLSPNDVTGRLKATNLSETTIQTLYLDIPSIAKEYAIGNYDPASRKISWLYNDSDDYNGNTFKYKYNRELVFDVVLQAFYTNTIGELDTDSPFISGYMPVGDFLLDDITELVVVDNDPVVVNGENVVVTVEGRVSSASQTKYLIAAPCIGYCITLGSYNENSFADWKTADGIGVDAPAFLITGYELFNDSQRSKYAPYITTHMRRTETGFTDDGLGNLTPTDPSGCLMQAQWDFANSSASGKWGSQIQIYRLTRSYMPSGAGDSFDYGHTMITTKNRLRGTGRALSLRFDTEPTKDAHIYGWAYSVEGGNSV